MRTLALLLVGSVVACGGEVSPDSSGTTTSSQQAGIEDSTSSQQQDEPENRHPVSTSSSGSPAATSDSSDSWNGYALPPEMCWNYGAEVPGECTIGRLQRCDGFTGASVMASGGPAAPFCEQRCVNINGKAMWSAKSYDEKCPFFDASFHNDVDGCSCAAQTHPATGSSTPLVLSFDDAPVLYTASAGGAFDLARDGVCHGSDWPTKATPWLALDRDGNGSIDDGSELFGSAVRLGSGRFAKNGFEALRELDANHDDVFDASDPDFARVQVWTDRNADRRSAPNELSSLSEAGVKAINLDDKRDMRCNDRGNCEGERSIFTSTTGHKGTVIDVYLKNR